MKVALITSLVAASAVSAAQISNRANREFEVSPTATVMLKYPVNFAELAAVGAAAAQGEKHDAVNNYLNRVAASAEKALSSQLQGLQYTLHSIGGGILVSNVDSAKAQQLASHELVTYIDLNTQNDFSIPDVIRNPNEAAANSTNEWGVDTVGAPEIWKYFNGKGVVVGSIDTGAIHTHEALKSNYRADKGWFDPYNKTVIPRDTDGHGSHTIGTMVGQGGIGVAPGAQWIACMGLYFGSGDRASLLSCAQFMLCPTRPDGTHPECKKGADVINNSWGGKYKYNPWFETAVAAWRAAGITPIFSQGNNGPQCETTGHPGGYPSVIAVGAVGSFTNDPSMLASFSSKGPNVYVDPATNKTVTLVKPDVSAPGFYTRSATNTSDTAYMSIAGTSMAAPHVAGVVALMKSAQSDLTYEEIYKYLTQTTDQKQLNTTEPEWWTFKNGTNRFPGAPNCGGVPDKQWPNNRFGHGRVNVGTILRDGKLHDTRRDAC